MAIILPEGYLCTPSYGYLRSWLLSHMRVVCLVELPRRIFLKSSADLRSNVILAQKLSEADIRLLIKRDYPIQTELVRKVGYKLGAGFSPIPKRDVVTGEILRDENNQVSIDSDFTGIRARFKKFTDGSRWRESIRHQPRKLPRFRGGRVSDILNHPELDMKPRRLMPNALENKQRLLSGEHFRLTEIADVVSNLYNLYDKGAEKKRWRLVEGMDIRANEGVVIPQFPARNWQIATRKGQFVYRLRQYDIVVGLVRPERRNIGMLLHEGDNIVGSPDGIAVVRVKEEYKKSYPETWLFYELRSERSRLQFWTESGGTSYGKLTPTQVENVIIRKPGKKELADIVQSVAAWRRNLSAALRLWMEVGTEEDRRPILNSAIIGLEVEEEESTSEQAEDREAVPL